MNQIQSRSRADEAAARGEEDDYEEDQSLKMEAELDRSLLRLMAAACQGDPLLSVFLYLFLSLIRYVSHKIFSRGQGEALIWTAERISSLRDVAGDQVTDWPERWSWQRCSHCTNHWREPLRL